MSKLLFLFMLLMFCISCSNNTARTTHRYETVHLNEQFRCSPVAQIKKEMLVLINAARAQPRRCGETRLPSAPALTWNSKLEQAATSHSRDMATADFFSHTGSDGSNVSERANAVGYEWRRIGENIYGGAEHSKQAVIGWLRSAGHCRNIMNPDFKEMGGACARHGSSQYGTYWTQVLGTN